MEGTLRGSIADVLEGQISGSIDLLAGEPVLENLSVSSNGVYEPRTGVDGFDKVIVDVPTDEPVLDDITITENGHYTPPSGVDGYDDITVNVPTSQPVLDDITINENGHYTPPAGTDGYNDITVYVPYVSQGTTINDNGTYTPPSGVDGFSQVIVNVPNTVQGLNVTENGTYTPPVGSGVVGYSPVTVNVPTPPPSLQSLIASHNGYFVPASGYDGFSEVTVNVASPSSLATGFIFNADDLLYKAYKGNSNDIIATPHTLISTWDGGPSAGLAYSFIPKLPSDVTKIRYKITTGTAFRPTVNDYGIFIGVKRSYTDYSVNTFLARNLYVGTEYTNTVIEDFLDISNLTGSFVFSVISSGWNYSYDYLIFE